jgi:histidine ammonia-lyase
MNSTANSELLSDAQRVSLGAEPLTIDALVELASGRAVADIAPEARERMQQSADVVARLHAAGAKVYGVTTSVGASVTTDVPPARSAELSLNLLRMHGCGTGRKLTEVESAAVLVARLSSLVQGRSGVRPEVADLLAALLEQRALPVIPAEGSVGASGDLTPLSYVAAVLAGEREVLLDGEIVDAAAALRRIGRAPLELGPKEALALMNGTSVASALTALAWSRSRRLARLASAITALNAVAIRGNTTHFDPFVHASKPHAGQRLSAEWIASDLDYQPASPDHGARLQDRYSIRCAPHVVGVLVDVLAWTRATLETELNGVSDNPVVDVERGIVVHGGNFYGGHVSLVADNLKAAVANVADLLDRQLQVVCNPAENEGLPANLVGVRGDGACAHNGFKAVTIATSALAAEALKLSAPASVFSRSTELHNQDKVPMATLAARELVRVVEVTEQITVMVLLAAVQAVELRGGSRSSRVSAICDAVRAVVPPLEADRRMDVDIEALLAALRENALPVGDETIP